jgi:hypothetical protein
MKPFSLLFILVLVDVGLAAGQDSASAAQGNEPSYEGKTINQWIAQAKDKDGLVRKAAANTLGQIGPKAKAAIPALTDLLKDENWWVRMPSGVE